MRERPILFSGPMIRAILAGQKTQTRRIVKPEPDWLPEVGSTRTAGGLIWPIGGLGQQCGAPLHKLPYGKSGDRLWVRESWQAWNRTSHEYDEWEVCAGPPSQILDQYGRPFIEYQATSESSGPWRPSIHMPRWASRILLEITDVRVERLQDISEADAIAEGAPWAACGSPQEGSHKAGFAKLWESINGPGAWEASPWVWVLAFKRVQPGHASATQFARPTFAARDKIREANAC